MVAVAAHQLHVDGVGRLAGDDHPVAALSCGLGPVGGEVVTQTGHVLEHDDRPAVLHAPQFEVQGGGRAGLDGAGIDLEGLRGGNPLIPLDQIAIELDLEAGGQLADDTAPGHGHDAGLEDHRNVFHRPAESHDVEQDHALVVGGVVEHLGHPHLVDLLADARQHQGQGVVGEPGVDPVDEDRDPALDGGVHHGGVHPLIGDPVRVLQEHRARRNNVDARTQHGLHVCERCEQAVVGHGGVDDHVGLEGEDGVDVVGGGHTEGAAEPGQLAGVLADLVGVGHPDTDQLQVRAGVDAGDGVLADVPGAPSDDTVGLAHGVLLTGGRW